MSTAPTYKPLEIEVTDFGPIAKAKLDLRPLTVFVGPSNTGKSYLATLIYALHQVFGGYATYPAMGQMKLDHHLYPRSFPSASSGRVLPRIWSLLNMQDMSDEDSTMLLNWTTTLLSKVNESENTDDIVADIPDAVKALIQPLDIDLNTLCLLLARELARCFGGENTASLVRHGSKSDARVVLKRQLTDPLGPAEPFGFEFKLGRRGDPDGYTLNASTPPASALKIEWADNDPWHRERIRRLQSHINRWNHGELQDRPFVALSLRDELVDIVGATIISPLGRTAHYLPASRTGLMQAHRVVAASSIQQLSLPGSQGDKALPTLSGVLADFLEQLVTFRDLPWKERRDGWLLAAKLEEAILGGEVHQSRSATGYPDFSYRPADRKEMIPLMQASSMVSELAPVVLYLRHVVQPGDVLIIEEPESHLHPGMQAEFTRQLAAVVRKGVRVMLTTHSDYVLEELANLVRMSDLPEEQRADLKGADQALSPDEVGVWLFEPGQQNEGSRVKEIPLDRDSGTFPAGYGAITEALYNTSVEIDSRIIESKNDQ